MKMIHVTDAVGMILAHDMTEIIPGVSKKALFKKGHVITEEDLPKLLNMGKEHIAVLELDEDQIHENDAAIRMARAAVGDDLLLSEPSEGKVNMTAAADGLLKINTEALLKINELEDIMLATLHTNRMVRKGTVVAGTRIIPLMTEKKNIEEMERICKEAGAVIQVIPLKKMKTGIVTTGSEVYHKRIEDRFGPVIKAKMGELDCEVIGQIFANDDATMIKDAILELIEAGAELITCTGGMSVDPDDVTPAGIRQTGARVVAYGAPILPGAMFMLAYLNGVPIVGLPGCVMYAKRTVFDLILPRILAGEEVTKKEISAMGHGGLCMECSVCTFPNCGFGLTGF